MHPAESAHRSTGETNTAGLRLGKDTMKLSRTQKLIGAAILGMLVLVVAAGVVLKLVVLGGETPARVNLSEAVQSATGRAPDPAVTGTAAPPLAARGDGSTGGLAGTWTLGSGGDSFVGYRVEEQLARIGANTAVGRTHTVTGTMQYDGSAITTVQVTADLTSLQSDSAQRDGALRRQALETGQYPKATFDLTQPIPMATVPAEGTPLNATAVGNLTLHGVTRPVSIPIQGQRTNGTVVVVGSMDIQFADYNIQPPKSFNVLSIADHGTLELQLVFEKAAEG